MSKFDSLPVTRLFTGTASASLEALQPSFRLHVDGGSSLAEIYVVDGNFTVVARGQGKLEALLPAGEYLIKFQTGAIFSERWIKLNQPLDVAAPEASAATSFAGWSPAESAFADSFRQRYNLSLVIHDAENTPPSDDVRIRRTDGTTLVQLDDLTATPGWTRGVESKVLCLGGNVVPGGYVIVVAARGLRPYAMPLWVASDCATQVFMERHTLGMGGSRRVGPQMASASIFIANSQLPALDAKRLLDLVQTSTSVLSYDRPVAPSEDEILAVLNEKFSCPMLGLLAAHLLRIKYQAETGTKGGLITKVVENLARLMPGSPDVGALQLAIGMPTTADFSVPPMLAHSWAILTGSTATPIPPDSYADRIRPAICATRPWLIWDKSRMTPDPAKPQRRIREDTLPPELQAAASQLGKHLKVEVAPDGRVTVTRK